jgi:hypothetical protein
MKRRPGHSGDRYLKKIVAEVTTEVSICRKVYQECQQSDGLGSVIAGCLGSRRLKDLTAQEVAMALTTGARNIEASTKLALRDSLGRGIEVHL